MSAEEQAYNSALDTMREAIRTAITHAHDIGGVSAEALASEAESALADALEDVRDEELSG